MQETPIQETLLRMREDWDERAKENARYYVATTQIEWTDEEFFRSGELEVEGEILNDMANICQGNDPKQMRIVEIGCGAGRMTRSLARVFGEVHAVDVSGEMIEQARKALHDCPNAFFYNNNGKDLDVLPPGPYDFAFSAIVFQHISTREVIYSYCREVHRLLRPGGLFKLQVQGDTRIRPKAGDTWLGIPFSDTDAVEMAEKCGFEPRHRHGQGGQYFWLWFFKR